jgi:hypothetical protein
LSRYFFFSHLCIFWRLKIISMAFFCDETADNVLDISKMSSSRESATHSSLQFIDGTGTGSGTSSTAHSDARQRESRSECRERQDDIVSELTTHTVTHSGRKIDDTETDTETSAQCLSNTNDNRQSAANSDAKQPAFRNDAGGNSGNRAADITEITDTSSRPIAKQPSLVRNLGRKQGSNQLTVSTDQCDRDTASYKDKEGLSSAARKAARMLMREAVSSLPLGTALNFNRIVIKLQARTRGILSRRQYSKQVPLQSLALFKGMCADVPQ